MATMGNYCKAYPVERFRSYPGWSEKVPPLTYDDEAGAEESREASASSEPEATEPADDSEGYYFLQENYTVTAGIFLDEQVAFDEVTDEWKEFCAKALEFEVPPYEFVHPEPADAPTSAEATPQN